MIGYGCVTVATGKKINNRWKLFRYGVKRDHYGKFIGIREFSELIAADCFNSNIKTDTGTPANNITSLDNIDNKGTVFNHRNLSYSSSSP